MAEGIALTEDSPQVEKVVRNQMQRIGARVIQLHLAGLITYVRNQGGRPACDRFRDRAWILARAGLRRRASTWLVCV